MIIAFSGSRDFDDAALVDKVLRRLEELHGHELVIQVGDALGLDLIVADWCSANLARHQWWKMTCHWPPRGASKQEQWMAAHERNARVVAGAVELLAFYGPHGVTSGTRDAVDQARENGVLVRIYNQFDRRWL